MRSTVVWILCLLHLCKGQSNNLGNDRGLLNRRPLHQQQSSPCWSGGSSDTYDSVYDDIEGRKYFLAAGAAVGGAALGYHLGMKHKTPVVINNNIHNEYPPPCIVVQHGGGGGGSGGGLISGILSHHPILSNILQGGLWNGGGGGGGGGNRLPPNRDNNINWNRAIRQFNRVIRPITRGFK